MHLLRGRSHEGILRSSPAVFQPWYGPAGATSGVTLPRHGTELGKRGRPVSDQGAGHQGILSLTIKDKAVLYSAYIPFIRNGGLFVPTNKSYEIGDEVFMLLTLMEEPEKIPIAGRVVWVTPRGAQGNRTSGIGVQFSEQDAAANSKIEEYLAGMLNSDRPTHTM